MYRCLGKAVSTTPHQSGDSAYSPALPLRDATLRRSSEPGPATNTHSYAGQGTYTVIVQASQGGQSALALKTVVVSDSGPSFTIRGIARGTSMLAYKLEPDHKVFEIRALGLDGEVGELAWPDD